MDPKYCKYLRFAFQNNLYQFKVLPFGLSTAPRMSTKVLSPVIGYLHRSGIHIYPYLDDCLIVGKSQEQLIQALILTIQVLQRVGFLINYKKSHLTPSQKLMFLGMQLDTVSQRAFLPREKADKYKAHVFTWSAWDITGSRKFKIIKFVYQCGRSHWCQWQLPILSPVSGDQGHFESLEPQILDHLTCLEPITVLHFGG